MRVMITGGTGFIGYHTAMALMAAGHEVSLLVRSIDKMNQLYGKGRIEHFTLGDITDADQVRQAMEGCDAAIHVAALVSTSARDSERVYQTNLQGTRNVIGTAVDMELPAIHVSSVTALYDPDASGLDENSPPGTSASGYGRSKVACEQYVRSLQEAGEPVYITYPASVLGPDAPALTEPHEGLKTYLAHFVPIMASGNQYVDARDIATVHRRILEEQPDCNRFILGGHYLSWPDLGDRLEALTGRSLRRLKLGRWTLGLMAAVCDGIGPWFNLELPLTKEGVAYASNWVMMDSSRVQQELDFDFRPVDETLIDSIRWLQQAGHLGAEEAGELAQ